MKHLTLERLKSCYTTTNETIIFRYLNPLNNTIEEFNIIQDEHTICAFIAQIGVESGNLTRTFENLNYSAKRLMQVFPAKFKSIEDAQNVVNGGQMAIAERIYGNRKELGNISIGDGWRFRGRGLIQLTGRTNYQAAANGLKCEYILKTPDIVGNNAAIACDVSGWFWSEYAKLNPIAKRLKEGGNSELEAFKQITKRINGGYNGLQMRIDLYNKAKKQFNLK